MVGRSQGGVMGGAISGRGKRFACSVSSDWVWLHNLVNIF